MTTWRTPGRILLVLIALAVMSPGRAVSQSALAPKTGAPDTAETHLGRGYDALKQDQYDLAAAEFRAALQLDPTLTLRARFPLAVALFELHQSDEARKELEIVRGEVGDHPNVLYYLGRLDLDSRDFQGAIRNLSQAAAKPPFPDTAYYLGYAYFKQGDLKSAEKWLKDATELTPRDARVPYQLGLVYRKEGLEQEAAKTLALSEEMRQRDSKESQLRMECGQKLDQQKTDPSLKQEAHAICDQLYDPDNPEKLTALGTIYGQHGDLEAALRPLRRAAELAPQSPQMQYNLALTYYQLGQFEQARLPLANSLKRWPDLFQLNALYGAVLAQLGDYPEAYPALRHAHQLNPQEPRTLDLLYTTTLALAKQSVAMKGQDGQDYSDSIRYLQEAAELRPQEPEPHRRMAEIYSHTGHAAQATAEQREADRLSSGPGGLQ